MDDLDKAIEVLKFHIKKEIVDNYFAERRYLEEDSQALDEALAAYQQAFARLRPLFLAFYAALAEEATIDRVMAVLGLDDRPFAGDFKKVAPEARPGLLRGFARRGFTARRRRVNLVLDVYRQLAEACQALQEQYHKAASHLRLLNEDIQKFNATYDFGLIAAQIEAMEGGGEVISGGLLASEREELSTRMRFKRRTLSVGEMPPPPSLPPLAAVKARLLHILL